MTKNGTITPEQRDALLRYLETDRDLCLASRLAWRVDQDKLDAALAESNIEVGKIPHSDPADAFADLVELFQHPEKWTPAMGEKVMGYVDHMVELYGRKAATIGDFRVFVATSVAGVAARDVESVGFDTTLIQGGADPVKEVRMLETLELAPDTFKYVPNPRYYAQSRIRDEGIPRRALRKQMPKDVIHAFENWCRNNLINSVTTKDGRKVPLLHPMLKPPKREKEGDDNEHDPAA